MLPEELQMAAHDILEPGRIERGTDTWYASAPG